MKNHYRNKITPDTNKNKSTGSKICNLKFVFICILFAVIVCFLCLRSSKAFEYMTDPADSSTSYTLSENEVLTQKIDANAGILRGVTVRIGTFQRINTGIITVTLNENGTPIRKSSLQSEYLTDNAYQKFYFSSPVKLQNDKQYSLSFQYEYDGEDNAIAPYISNGGDMTSSFTGTTASTLVYQLILLNSHIRNIALAFFIILFSGLFLLYVYKTNLEKMNVWKVLLLGLIMLIGIEAVSTDLMPSILRNVEIDLSQESDTQVVIKSGESFESSFNATYTAFNRLEIFPSDYDAVNLTISLTGNSNARKYFERTFSENQLITDQNTGKNALLISADMAGENSFPMDTYTLTIKNNGDEPISFNSIEAESGTSLNTGLFRTTWVGYLIAFGILGLTILYIFIVFLKTRTSLSVEKYFLLSVIPLGIIYFVLFQAWNMPDTGSHFQAAYRLSNIMLGYKPSDAWYIRVDDYNYWTNMMAQQNPNPSMRSLLGTILRSGIHNKFFVQDASLIPWPNPEYKMEFYSLISYFPEVLGITIARILHLGTVPMICLGRLFMLSAYIGCAYHAIKITPVGKYVFMTFSLLPMALMMSGAISYDGMVIITSICFCAAILRLYKKQDDKKYLIESAFWAFMIGGTKGGGYLVLLPLTFILISKDWKKTLKLILPICLAGLGSVLLFDSILPTGALFQFGNEASGKLSTSWGFSHMTTYLDMLIKTYIAYMDILTINMGGNLLGWLESTLPSTIVIGIMLIGGCGSIFESDTLKLQKKDRNIFMFVIFLEIFFTPIMLLSFTDVGATRIEGLQGRYFMPVLPLIFMIFTKFLMRNSVNAGGEESIAIGRRCYRLIALLSVAVVYIMLRLYLTR